MKRNKQEGKNRRRRRRGNRRKEERKKRGDLIGSEGPEEIEE
jgi:hypothetical protein